MRASHPLAIGALLVTVGLLTACSDGRAPAGGVHQLGPGFVVPVAGQQQSASFHGSAVGTVDCKDCHDVQALCSDCHFGQSGSRAPAQSGWAHPQIVGHDQLQGSGAVCNSCHELERRAGQGPAPCHDCHGSGLPHAVDASWMLKSAAFHGTSALQCESCHGTRANFCNECHFGETGARTPPGSAWTHGKTGHPDQAASGAVCRRCHEIEQQLRDAPAVTTCGNCHDNQLHDVPFGAAHVAAAQANGASCAACHGDSGAAIGPDCSTCHTAGSPLTATNCTSCHTAPPAGTSAPDRAGAHGTHRLLVATDACEACHSGAGTGTARHFDGATDVGFLSNYDARTGAATYDTATGTCSNVSCHGGQTTPAWGTGALDAAQCASCHTLGNAQYNGYFSGQHQLHVEGKLLPCTACHDRTELDKQHFSDLRTPTISEGSAAATLRPNFLLQNYDPVTRTCTTVCHAPKNWF